MDKTITGSEALWLSLLEEGADTVFGYPGGQIMPVYDSLIKFQDRIRHILVRHEQGFAFRAYYLYKILDVDVILE